MADRVLGYGLRVAENPHEGRLGIDPHDILQILHHPSPHLVVRQLDVFRETGSSHHAPQEHLPLRGPVLEHARVPEGAEGTAAFLLRDQVAETVQRVGDVVTLVAEADHGHAGIGDLIQNCRHGRIDAVQHCCCGKSGRGDDDNVGFPVAAVLAAHPVGRCEAFFNGRNMSAGLDDAAQ